MMLQQGETDAALPPASRKRKSGKKAPTGSASSEAKRAKVQEMDRVYNVQTPREGKRLRRAIATYRKRVPQEFIPTDKTGRIRQIRYILDGDYPYVIKGGYYNWCGKDQHVPRSVIWCKKGDFPPDFLRPATGSAGVSGGASPRESEAEDPPTEFQPVTGLDASPASVGASESEGRVRKRKARRSLLKPAPTEEVPVDPALVDLSEHSPGSAPPTIPPVSPAAPPSNVEVTAPGAPAAPAVLAAPAASVPLLPLDGNFYEVYTDDQADIPWTPIESLQGVPLRRGTSESGLALHLLAGSIPPSLRRPLAVTDFGIEVDLREIAVQRVEEAANHQRLMAYIIALRDALRAERARSDPTALARLQADLAAAQRELASSREDLAASKSVREKLSHDLRKREISVNELLKRVHDHEVMVRVEKESARKRQEEHEAELRELKARMEAEVAEAKAQGREEGRKEYRDSPDFKTAAVAFCREEIENTLLDITEELDRAGLATSDLKKSGTLAPFVEKYLNLPVESDGTNSPDPADPPAADPPANSAPSQPSEGRASDKD